MPSICIGWYSRYKNWPLVTTTWTLGTCTDLYWQWHRLWIPVLVSHDNDRDCANFDWPLVAMTGTLILVLISSCNDLDSKYFYWPLVPKAATLDTLLTSSGNNWVSGYFYWHLVTITGTLNTFTDILWQWCGLLILLLTTTGNDKDSRY